MGWITGAYKYWHPVAATGRPGRVSTGYDFAMQSAFSTQAYDTTEDDCGSASVRKCSSPFADLINRTRPVQGALARQQCKHALPYRDAPTVMEPLVSAIPDRF